MTVSGMRQALAAGKACVCPTCGATARPTRHDFAPQDALLMVVISHFTPRGGGPVYLDLKYFMERLKTKIPELYLGFGKSYKWEITVAGWDLGEPLDDALLKPAVKRFRKLYPESKGKKVSLRSFDYFCAACVTNPRQAICDAHVWLLNGKRVGASSDQVPIGQLLTQEQIDWVRNADLDSVGGHIYV